MRFIVLSDEGERLGEVTFDDAHVDAESLPNEAVADAIGERFRDLLQSGAYDQPETLIRATLERVSAETGVRFVRDPDDV